MLIESVEFVVVISSNVKINNYKAFVRTDISLILQFHFCGWEGLDREEG